MRKNVPHFERVNIRSAFRFVMFYRFRRHPRKNKIFVFVLFVITHFFAFCFKQSQFHIKTYKESAAVCNRLIDRFDSDGQLLFFLGHRTGFFMNKKYINLLLAMIHYFSYFDVSMKRYSIQA